MNYAPRTSNRWQNLHLRAAFAVVSAVAVLVCCGGLGLRAVAQAQDSSSSVVSQSFSVRGANSSLVAGAVVSLASNTPRTVQPADISSRDTLLGVISKTPVLALSATGNNQVQVAITGDAPALVSDINGVIKNGDKITASPISGVGMKATSDGQVIGSAQQAFNLSTATAKQIKDRTGNPHTVHVGQVLVRINASYFASPSSEILPPFLQKIANSIAGRSVSLVRILLVCVLIVMAVVGISAVLYGSTHSAITSIGRNPLAARAINQGLARVAFAALLILTFALLSSYLILTV